MSRLAARTGKGTDHRFREITVIYGMGGCWCGLDGTLFARQPWNRLLGLRWQVIPGGMWTAMDGAEYTNRAERGGAAKGDFQVIASKSDGAGDGFCFGFFFLK